MMDVRLLPEAEFDLAEAALFLEHRAAGLGDSLVAEVENAIRRVQENPLVGPDRGSGVHSLLVHRFPYSLIYRVLSDHVLILR